MGNIEVGEGWLSSVRQNEYYQQGGNRYRKTLYGVPSTTRQNLFQERKNTVYVWTEKVY